LRIFALWCVRHRGAPDSFTVWTSGGIVHCVVSGENVRVNMGVASTWGPEQIAGFEAYRVNMGNPHAVIFAQPPDWRTAGSVIENAVPGRTNVQFVEMLGSTPSILIWERGAGETMSSGSSACAVATICVQHGFCTSPVTVKMPGGSLLIWVGEQIEMEGPVEAIGMVDVDPTWISRRF
jgi:diaminopimelate epimerase